MNKLKSFVVAVTVAIAAIGSSANPASAVLISIDDATFGVDSVTRDTVTGLEWLDVNKSAGVSFLFITTGIGGGAAFAGWRHATTPELTALFETVGYPAGYHSATATQRMIDTINMLGRTHAERSSNGIGDLFMVIGVFNDGDGLLDSGDRAGDARLSFETRTGSRDPFGPPIGDSSAIKLDQHGGFFLPSTAGNWLVRDTATESIPEPGTLAIVLFGLAGFRMMQRRISQSHGLT